MPGYRVITSIDLGIGPASVRGGAAPARSQFCRVTATVPCRVRVLHSATATATAFLLQPPQEFFFTISQGESVAVIAEGAVTGKANVSYLTQG